MVAAMTLIIRTLKLLGIAAPLVALAGCSNIGPRAASATSVPVATATTPAAEKETITGSRIPSKTTDRMVKVIGATGVKEMERAQPGNPGPRNY
jgi:hypothetical protein